MKFQPIARAERLLVGVIYNLINRRSPAPPVTAPVGLFGILAGEPIPPPAKNLWSAESLSEPWLRRVRPPVMGHPPKGRESVIQTADEASNSPA